MDTVLLDLGPPETTVEGGELGWWVWGAGGGHMALFPGAVFPVTTLLSLYIARRQTPVDFKNRWIFDFHPNGVTQATLPPPRL